MRIEFVMFLCLLVFAACSDDREDSTDIMSQDDDTRDGQSSDINVLDTDAHCNPLYDMCPCDLNKYPTDFFVCCNSTMSGFFCRNSFWVSYDYAGSCPSEQVPNCSTVWSVSSP
jgi:hypothetical protein